jgi:2-C-methyl-D-erythritol 4-phosphate cytidylyltransferase
VLATRTAKADAKGGGARKLLAALSPISSAEAAESVPVKTRAHCVSNVHHGVASKAGKRSAVAGGSTRAKSAQRGLAQKPHSKSKKTVLLAAREHS